MVVYTYIPSTGDAEAGGHEFQANLEYCDTLPPKPK